MLFLRFLLLCLSCTVGLLGIDQPTFNKIEQSLKEGKMLYVLFYDTKNASTTRIEQMFAELTQELGSKAIFVEVPLKDSSFEAIKKSYPSIFQSNLPLPFVTILSPNGASMGVYPAEHVTKKAMMESYATCSSLCPEIQQFIRAIQEQKIVFLCLQNRHTKGNEQALAGVEAYLKKPENAGKAVKIICDPANPKLEKFLQNFQLHEKIENATTVMLTKHAVDKFIYVGQTYPEQLTKDLARS